MKKLFKLIVIALLIAAVVFGVKYAGGWVDDNQGNDSVVTQIDNE